MGINCVYTDSIVNLYFIPEIYGYCDASGDKNDIQLCCTHEQKEIIDNIDIKYINNYQSWLKIIWALYNQFNSYHICDYVSKKATEKYKGIKDIIKHLQNDKKHLLTFGTICYYSKVSNQENYIKIDGKR